ncbi:N-acetylmuramoyl-L-alanine amidase [Streptomyces sp. NPDC058417]|uniref:N-acetylmuramoyl-L-alanine amidase n=1 Tax=unclassified Streptomyces TaxID=2593676 RepID=UPI003663A8FE
MWSKVYLVAAAAVGVMALQASPAPATQQKPTNRAPEAVPAHTEQRAVRVLPDRRAAVLPAAETGPFSMLGVTWDDPQSALVGRVEVRTRDALTGAWTEWRRLDGDDGRSEESARRGGTDPLWVGPSNGAEVRIAADADQAAGLPAGLRLDLIDPRAASAPQTGPETVTQGAPGTSAAAPRPAIVSRAGWGADESISPASAVYTPSGKIKAFVVHHTAGSNNFTCAQAPSVIRGVFAYHVQQLGWRDIGYNFLVDTCGTIYEGRKGGVDRAVLGAHTYGFNSQTSGVAVLGDYSTKAPPAAVTSALSKLAAWKLGQYSVKPNTTTTLAAGADGGNYFHKTWKLNASLSFPTIFGHRDGFNTECPGDKLYAALPTIRSQAAAVRTTAAEEADGQASSPTLVAADDTAATGTAASDTTSHDAAAHGSTPTG